MENHVIICNWNERAEDLIGQLNLYSNIGNDIVIIDDDLDLMPLKNVQFVKGSPSETKTLLKANIMKASKIIIMAKGDQKSNADANTVLTALAIRNLNTNVFICAEILDTENGIFLKNARVNEVIDINSIVSRFIAQTTSDPKLLEVLQELVSNDENTCEIYRVKLPEIYKDKPYGEIFTLIKEKYDCIVIALEDSGNGKVIMNPKFNKVYNADYSIVIAEDQPVFA